LLAKSIFGHQVIHVLPDNPPPIFGFIVNAIKAVQILLLLVRIKLPNAFQGSQENPNKVIEKTSSSTLQNPGKS
jgi:hypothetical protein